MQLARKIKNLTELEKLSEILLPYLQPNIYLILQGELGVGKTTLAQLIAKKMGIKEKITSPTFTILQRYQIKENYYLNHFDFFRLSANDNLDFFQELTIDNLNIIEWGEKNLYFWQNKRFMRINLVKLTAGARLVQLDISFPLIKSWQHKLTSFFGK